MVNLDTHVFLFVVAGTLRPRELAALRGQLWGVSSLVLWEIWRLHEARKIDLGLDDAHLQRVLSEVRVWPVTEEVARTAARLDFRADPCDELIAATSLVHNAPLLTRDRRISASKVVPLALRQR